MKNSYQTSTNRYKDIQESTYDRRSKAFNNLSVDKRGKELTVESRKDLLNLLTSGTTLGSLPEVDWDKIEEGANSKEHFAKELHNLYIDKRVFMGNKQNIYDLNKAENLEEYNIELGSHVKKLGNILGKVLENGAITLNDGRWNFEISKFIGVETVGENIRNADRVIGLLKEVNTQAPETNDFNHHPVFVFEDQNGEERKITYHALLEMKVH